MDIASDAPCGWMADSTNEENHIREIFFHHWIELREQFQAPLTQICQWREKMIDDINKHANEQIHILTDDYNRQKLILDQTREENLDTTRAYSSANNIELFDELKSACQLFEFQVSQLELVTASLNVWKVITVQEQIHRKKEKEKVDASIREINKPEEKPIKEHAEEAHLKPSAIKSSNDDTQSTLSNTTHAGAETANIDGSTDNCPICFMMFPTVMSVDSRHRHINEHYTDE